jgi:uncharacterized membrane protein
VFPRRAPLQGKVMAGVEEVPVAVDAPVVAPAQVVAAEAAAVQRRRSAA